MKANHIATLKHLDKDYDYNSLANNTRVYLYDYDVRVRNPVVIQAWGYVLQAFMCNATTRYKEEMYDHSAKLEAMLKDRISLVEIDEILNKDLAYKNINVKEYRLKNVTPEAAQHIINRNILAINKLNEYILEKQMIAQIESV